jgi:hypothetical protein
MVVGGLDYLFLQYCSLDFGSRGGLPTSYESMKEHVVRESETCQQLIPQEWIQ